MANRLMGAEIRLHARRLLAVSAALLCAVTPVLAQHGTRDSRLESPPQPVARYLPYQLLDKPSQPPAFTIAVQTLGFSAPASYYMGNHNSLVSLDFLDEDRLLFTFRVPGLIRREDSEREALPSEAADREAANIDQRQIRAIVLTLPAGAVEAEALWTVHDRLRYLWMLKDGQFLLRDRNALQMGNDTLELKPYLRFPGPLLYLETDPTQQLLVTDSREPEVKREAETIKEPPSLTVHPSDENSSLHPGQQKSLTGDTDSPATKTKGAPDKEADAQKPPTPSSMIVRILRRDSGQVILVSHTKTAIHLPINADGYLESLRADHGRWLLSLRYFNGGSANLGQVDSTCAPILNFLSQLEVLATVCTPSGDYKLLAVGTDARHLWEYTSFKSMVWPHLVRSPDGSRLAWETLAVSPQINAQSSLDQLNQDDVRGQLVEIINAADGKVVLDAPARPALDAGGNVAISPSGRRVAVLNNSQIDVFDLPLAPSLPAPSVHPPAH